METFFPLAKALFPNKEPLYTRSKPMQVLALGLSWSGIESLSKALTRLGYEDVYHGLQFVEYRVGEIPQWYRLTRAKQAGNNEFLNQTEFDKVLGRSMAVTDVPCCAFGSELIRVYPHVSVVMNQRRDSFAGQKSIQATLIGKPSTFSSRLIVWFQREVFWTGMLKIHVFEPMMVQPLLQCPEGMTRAYEFHYERLRKNCVNQGKQYLDWDLSDYWEPLCKFLGKPVSNEPLPEGNTAAEMARFGATVHQPRVKRAKINMVPLAVASMGALISSLFVMFR